MAVWGGRFALYMYHIVGIIVCRFQQREWFWILRGPRSWICMIYYSAKTSKEGNKTSLSTLIYILSFCNSVSESGGYSKNWLWISPKDVGLYLYSEFQLHELCMILFLALFSYLIFIYAYSSPTWTSMTGRSCLIFKLFFMHCSYLVLASPLH